MTWLSPPVSVMEVAVGEYGEDKHLKLVMAVKNNRCEVLQKEYTEQQELLNAKLLMNGHSNGIKPIAEKVATTNENSTESDALVTNGSCNGHCNGTNGHIPAKTSFMKQNGGVCCTTPNKPDVSDKCVNQLCC